MPHNFWKSLDFEGSKTKLADQFYYHTFGIESHVRFDTGSEFDMDFQGLDIDLQLNAWGRHTNVSEKFRDNDFGDLYLEVFSMYPDTPGWTTVEGADHLAYFFPLRMFWIKKPELKEVFNKHIEPYLDHNAIASWVKNNPNRSGKYSITLEGFEMTMVFAFNQIRKRTWTTVGITVPFNFLEFKGLKWREYRL